jgi:hypothetical protein
MGRSAEASEALKRAIGLCEDQAVRDYLGRAGCRAHPERCRFTHKSCSRATRRVGVPCRGPSARRAHRQPNGFVPSLLCGDDRVTGTATPTGQNFRLRLPQRPHRRPARHCTSIRSGHLSPVKMRQSFSWLAPRSADLPRAAEPSGRTARPRGKGERRREASEAWGMQTNCPVRRPWRKPISVLSALCRIACDISPG